MQTFMPYPDFKKSAMSLDNKRLGKQRVEGMQLLQALWSMRLTNTTERVFKRNRTVYTRWSDALSDWVSCSKREARLFDAGSVHAEVVPVFETLDLPVSEWRIEHLEKPGWARHPAGLMWLGHEGALVEYTTVVCEVWRARGCRDSVAAKVAYLYDHSPVDQRNSSMPPWLGDSSFHASHQSNLNAKDPSFYTFDVAANLPYVWPQP